MSHWTTSGGSRLKAKQNRSFARRAQQRAKVVAPQALTISNGQSVGTGPGRRPNHPSAPRWTEAKKKYPLANPIARRGVVVRINGSNSTFRGYSNIVPAAQQGYGYGHRRRIRDPNASIPRPTQSQIHERSVEYNSSAAASFQGDQYENFRPEPTQQPRAGTSAIPPFARQRQFHPATWTENRMPFPQEFCAYEYGRPQEPPEVQPQTYFVERNNTVTTQKRQLHEAHANGLSRFRKKPNQCFDSGQEWFDTDILEESWDVYENRGIAGTDEYAGTQSFIFPESTAEGASNEEHQISNHHQQLQAVDNVVYCSNPQEETTSIGLACRVHNEPMVDPAFGTQSRRGLATPRRLWDVYIPSDVSYRAPSDVTDECTRISDCHKNSFSVPGADKAYCHQDTTEENIGAIGQRGGISRFRLRNGVDTAQGIDPLRPGTPGKNQSQYLPRQSLEPDSYDGPHCNQGLRFFDNGVEVDCSGRPLSKPGSPGCSSTSRKDDREGQPSKWEAFEPQAQTEDSFNTNFLHLEESAQKDPIWQHTSSH